MTTPGIYSRRYVTPSSGQMPNYRAYSRHNFRKIEQLAGWPEDRLFDMEVVARVLPFRTNNYVVDELINWADAPHDPLFKLTFPQREMLKSHDFDRLSQALRESRPEHEIGAMVRQIRSRLNPQPGGQTEHNIPYHRGQLLQGVQHKYPHTVLFFPKQSQTCHAYCTFCFRWAQFVATNKPKFATAESQRVVDYLRAHPEVTDLLVTGGDPLIMRTSLLSSYLTPFLTSDLPNLQTIRIGTKALSFWPYRFLSEGEGNSLLALFRRLIAAGKHVALMAHFSHQRELSTRAVREAVRRIRDTGVQIRTQSPLLRHINDTPDAWAKMWREQVRLGCIPYYMFVVRDTGAQHYFGLPLVEAWRIFNAAWRQVSGLARTVRGPSMSCTDGKVQVVGISKLADRKVIVLNRLQSRDPELAGQPLLACYDETAQWIDQLELLPEGCWPEAA